jgi:molecular chaperone DnaK
VERAKRGIPKVDVTFELDANGILTVTAQDQTTKAKADIKITQAVGHLSPGEIERMVQAAAQMKAEDDKVLARLEARNELEQLIYYCKEAAEERGSARLEKLADTVALWLEDADAATTDIKDYTARKRELESAMNKPDEEEGKKKKK